MREVKFRAWNKREKIMIPWVTAIDLWHRSVRGFPNDGTGLSSNYGLEDLELMEYTGLKDKNGKEIYEGDIVKRYDDDPREVVFNTKLDTEECWSINGLPHFGLKEHDYTVAMRGELEVIGNVWKNPELLEGNK